MSYNLLLFLKVYALAVPIFFVIDIVWLGLVARQFYAKQIGHLLGEVNWPVAIIFYLLFIIGIVLFAVMPAIQTQDLVRAVLLGAAFGFFTYMTYDLTNLATLKDWPVLMVVVDIVWGTVLSATVAGLSFWLAGLLGLVK